MLKKAICFIAMFCFAVLMLPSQSFCQDGEALFNLKCGRCHSSDGEAKVFAPVKYASSQWVRFFQRDKHKRKKDISNEISSSEIEAIKQFLVDHAADSDRPIAAGLR